MEQRGKQEFDGGADAGAGATKGAGGAKRGARKDVPTSPDKVLAMLARLEKQVVDLQRQNEELGGPAEAGEAPAPVPPPASAGGAGPAKKAAKPAKPAAAAPAKAARAPRPEPAAKPAPAAKPEPAAKAAPAKSDAPWWAQHAAPAPAPPPPKRTPPPPAAAPPPAPQQAEQQEEEVDEGEPEGEDDESEPDAAPEATGAEAEAAGDADAADLTARLEETRAQLEEAYQAIGGLEAAAGGEVEEEAVAIEPAAGPDEAGGADAGAAAAGADMSADDGGEVIEDAEIARMRQQIEKLRAALEKRDQEIEGFEQRLQKALAAAQGAGTDKLVEAQRHQIERLTEQLNAHQGQGVPGAALRERDERIAALEAELAGLRGEKATGVGRVVGGLMDAITGRKDGEDAGGLEERLRQLVAERDQLQQTVQQAMREAEDAKQRLREQLAADDPEDEGRASVVESLQQEVERLNRELAEARHQEKGVKHDRTQRQINESQVLRDKAAQVAQARDSLARTEKVLIRKWARQRAVIIQAYIVGIALVCATASIGAANLFLPPTITAVVDLRARTHDGQRLSPERAEAWADWHVELLSQPSFHRTLAKRLADRRLDHFADPAVLASRLGADLSVDATIPEVLTLTLAGSNRKETMALLDAIGTTLERESLTQAGLRQDQAVAALTGERYEDGRRFFASQGDAPIKDRRKVAAAVLFVLTMGGSVLGIVRLNRWLLTSKAVMDDAATFFDSPQPTGQPA